MMASLSWEKVGRAIADAAPILGGLAGGPAGSAVGQLIASTLGTAADPDTVLATINANPDTLLKIKQLEADEREHIRNMQLETLKAELGDTQNARQAHANHWMPEIITLALGAMTCAMGAAIIYMPIPEGSRDIAIQFGGQLLLMFGTAVAYWIGTSRSSFNKDQALIGRQ